jgi:hypothetical protein
VKPAAMRMDGWIDGPPGLAREAVCVPMDGHHRIIALRRATVEAKNGQLLGKWKAESSRHFVVSFQFAYECSVLNERVCFCAFV